MHISNTSGSGSGEQYVAAEGGGVGVVGRCAQRINVPDLVSSNGQGEGRRCLGHPYRPSMTPQSSSAPATASGRNGIVHLGPTRVS